MPAIRIPVVGGLKIKNAVGIWDVTVVENGELFDSDYYKRGG